MYVALALAVVVIALLAARPVLERDRVAGDPSLALAARRLEWGALGVRAFAWIAGAGLVLVALVALGSGVAWPPMSMRIAAGLAGAVLLWLGQLWLAPSYRTMSNALAGAAIGILCAVTYANLVYWQASLPMVILDGALLAVAAARTTARGGSILIALLGLVGGFAMPALLPSLSQPARLFPYLLLLAAGMAWIAIRRRSLLLMTASVVLCAIYEWVWVLQYLTSSQLLLATAVFAAFAVVGTSPLWFPRQDERQAGPRPGALGFRRLAAAAAHLPLLLALYLATVPNYGAQSSILFGFLLIVDVLLLAVAWRGGTRWPHAAGGIATLLIFGLWLRLSYTHASWPWSLFWLALFVALYLLEATPFAGLLFFVFIGLALQEPQHAAALIAAMLAMLAVVLLAAIRRGKPLVAVPAIALSAVALMLLEPPLLLAVATHALLLAALFAVAWISERHLLAVLAIPFYVAAVITASALPSGSAPPAATLLLVALVPYALFVAYPMALGARVRQAIAPHLAAVLASLVFCAFGWTARNELAVADRWAAGLVPLAAALAMLALLWRLRTRAPGEPRLTLIAAAALAFFNAAVPMLLPAPWTVLAWSVEVVALTWLLTRLGHRLLLWFSLLVAAAVFFRLAFDADLYAPWLLYAVYPAAGGAMIAAAYLARRVAPALQRTLSVAGLLELWFLLNIVIANYHHAANGALNFDFRSTPHAADAVYTIAWAVIATALLVLGFRIGWPAARGAALALLLTTIFKCLWNDLPRLRGNPLASSLLGLALSLAVVSVMLQKRWSAKHLDRPV